MPRYDFRCHDCTAVFEEERTMAQAALPASCPSCGSDHTYKLLSQIAIMSSARRVESAPTLGGIQGGGCGCGGSCACGAH